MRVGEQKINFARYLYLGVTLLNFSEQEVRAMTPHKVLALFDIHKEFNPDKFGQDTPTATTEGNQSDYDTLNSILGGLN